MKILSKILCMLLCISMAVGVLASCEVALGGDDDAYIEELKVNKKGELIVVFSDGEEENFGVFSPDGEEDGIVDIAVSKKGKMTLEMANGKSKTVGYTYTDENEDDDEVIVSVKINEDGELIVTRADESEENLGKVRDINIPDVPPDPPIDENDDIIDGDSNVAIRYFDEEWKPFSNAVVCDDDILWEPGRVSVTYFELQNEENNNMEFSLSAFVSFEVSATNSYGNTVCLSDYIKYSFVLGMNGEKSPFPNNTTAYNVASESAFEFADGHTESIILPPHSVSYFALVVFMPAEVGNEANTQGNASLKVSLGASVKEDCIHIDENYDGFCDDCGQSVELGAGTTDGLEFYRRVDGRWESIDTKNNQLFAINYAWEPGGAYVFYCKVHNGSENAKTVSFNAILRENTPSQNVYGDKFYVTSVLRYGCVMNENPEDPSFFAPDEAIERVKDRNFAANMQMMTSFSLSANYDLYFAVVVYMPSYTSNIYSSYSGTYDLYLNVGFDKDFSYNDVDFCREHTDIDKDLKCDKCGTSMPSGSCSHCDDNGDGNCDYCGVPYAWWDGITYDETSLVFQMTHCSNNEELTSGCERYLAGEDHNGQDIDDLIARRNEEAYEHTRVNVTYVYCSDIAGEYGWGNNIDRIYNEVCSNGKNSPDMYCNFVHDLVCASLKGSFANLYSTVRGNGNNFFNFEEIGYMYDYMMSLTLSLDKMYVVASDYFIDLVRAFVVVPINRALYESIADITVEDLNSDGVKDINDFYEEIYNGGWTYERLAQYAGSIYCNTSSASSYMDIYDTLGFALGTDGIHSSGLVYTSYVSIIHKVWDEDNAEYYYYYPTENEELYDLSNAINELFCQSGVYFVDGSEIYTYGSNSSSAIRNRFCNNGILFGGIITVGSLENVEYQMMKYDGDFAIAPVPVYREGDPYLTHIHSLGRAGAISNSTTKFAQCTAFLHYQSTHSSDILGEYYHYKLSYEVTNGYGYNVEMLNYLRMNVRGSYDMTFENAIAYFQSTVYPSNHALHTIIADNSYNLRYQDMRSVYYSIRESKQQMLDMLINEYSTLPD